jgi:hypothetical protein
MMVMVSLNLADIMTATRPRTWKPLHDDSDDPINTGQLKSEHVTKCEDADPVAHPPAQYTE